MSDNAGKARAAAPAPRRLPVGRRYVFFLLAALAVLMAAIDATIVAVAVPHLSGALHAPLGWVSLVLTGYQLAQVLMLPLAGKLADLLGRKRVFIGFVAAFTLGSLLCGLAPSIGLLVFFRVLQGLGGGGLMPSAVGIVSDQFRERRAQAIGLFTSAFPLGGIIGPNLGGFILERWGWRELFLINVPIGIVVVAAVLVLLPADVPVQKQARLDFAGLGLFAAAMFGMLYGLSALGDDPELMRSPWIWGLIVVGVALLVFFMRHIRRTPDPLVEPELVVRSPFSAANAYNFLFGAGVFGFFSFVPYYVVVKYHMGTAESGMVLTPRALMSMIVTMLASVFIIRLGYRLPMIAGVALMATTLVLLGLLPDGGFWTIAAVLALSGVGMGLAGPSSNNAAIDLAPGKAAAITGLRGMFRQTGGVVGIAGIVLALTFFPDQATGLSIIFLVLAGVLLLTIPLTFAIPDTARQRLAAERAAPEPAPPRPTTALGPARRPGA